jgi:hypothetical protein
MTNGSQTLSSPASIRPKHKLTLLGAKVRAAIDLMVWQGHPPCQVLEQFGDEALSGPPGVPVQPGFVIVVTNGPPHPKLPTSAPVTIEAEPTRESLRVGEDSRSATIGAPVTSVRSPLRAPCVPA